MNEKISGFVICVEVIIHLLLHNLHDCTFKNKHDLVNETQEEDKDLSLSRVYTSLADSSQRVLLIFQKPYGVWEHETRKRNLKFLYKNKIQFYKVCNFTKLM